jgi:ABC-type multidrug transport system fused ATPase/permease subunit
MVALRGGLLGLERLEEILQLPAEGERTVNPVRVSAVSGRIELDHVSFGYKPYRTVLRDVKFAIEPGETVAIVGETGSGKTTVASLIAGFYLPTEGRVLVDGVSTDRVQPDELRRHVSAVFQVVETGRHDELWERRGRYYELFRSFTPVEATSR